MSSYHDQAVAGPPFYVPSDHTSHQYLGQSYDGYNDYAFQQADSSETDRGGFGDPFKKVKDTLKPINDALKPVTDIFKKIDPTNKNSELRALFRDVDRLVLTPVAGILEQVLVSPFLATFIQSLEVQINDGRAKHLPEWLKPLIASRYPEVNINNVRYGENIKMVTVEANTAITIGYNIYFPGSINLDPHKVITTSQQGWDLGRDVHWILHEIEHIVQFLKVGGSKSAFLIKYLGSIVSNANVNPNAWHDAIPLERAADAKADALLNYVLAGYAQQHSTFYFSATAHGPDKSRLALHEIVNQAELPGWVNGHFLVSPNSQFSFEIRGDGSLVLRGSYNWVVWEAKRYGKACPPFVLGCDDQSTCMTLSGLMFEPRGNALNYRWERIWYTAPVPFTQQTGGYYLVDPNWSGALQSGLWLEVTDKGNLRLMRGRLGSQPWEWKEIWSTPDAAAGGITTTVIEGTETTLPAVVRPRAHSAPFLGYQDHVPAVPHFRGQMMY